MAKVALNTMVAPETMEAIKKMASGKSQGQVVDEAVAALQGGDRHGEVGRWFRETWVRLEEILETVQSAEAAPIPSSSSLVKPGSIPGVHLGLPSGAPVIIKRYRCDHCGVSPAVPRVGDICSDCREKGHMLSAAECPVCTGGAGI